MTSIVIISPLSGPMGSIISITGNGFLHTSPVTITFGGTSMGTITSDGNGNISGTITVPTTSGPNVAYDQNSIVLTDGTNTANAFFELLPPAEYCTPQDVANWLRIDINANTTPNLTEVQRMILMNQEDIDYKTGHTWQKTKFHVYDQFDVWPRWDWGRGMPIYLKHRMVQQFDTTQGDVVEIWDGMAWQPQASNNSGLIYFDTVQGIMYVRGYLFSILTANRFRVTYRYGGTNEGSFQVPRDIKKTCLLMTAIDILSTDFKFSQVSYGAEGNINKKDIIEKWENWIKQKLVEHGEILTII